MKLFSQPDDRQDLDPKSPAQPGFNWRVAVAIGFAILYVIIHFRFPGRVVELIWAIAGVIALILLGFLRIWQGILLAAIVVFLLLSELGIVDLSSIPTPITLILAVLVVIWRFWGSFKD